MKVEPIRDKQVIRKFREILRKNSYRDYMIFSFGINTGLRISDILKLKVKDVRGKDRIRVIEQKTINAKKHHREHIVHIVPQLMTELYDYTEKMKDEEYLFQSRKGTNKPITTIHAYKILNDIAKELNIKHIGTHTLRKTFGYWHYQQHKDINLLMQLLNHYSPSDTLRYIGQTEEQKKVSMIYI